MVIYDEDSKELVIPYGFEPSQEPQPEPETK